MCLMGNILHIPRNVIEYLIQFSTKITVNFYDELKQNYPTEKSSSKVLRFLSASIESVCLIVKFTTM